MPAGRQIGVSTKARIPPDIDLYYQVAVWRSTIFGCAGRRTKSGAASRVNRAFTVFGDDAGAVAGFGRSC
jgi:hypothetical protein